MLGGVSPILIFQFGKIPFIGDVLSNIPIVSEIPTIIDQPPIPIYLDEGITKLLIVSENKNIDIDTSVETMSDGSTPASTQKGISSNVTINFEANSDSIGVTMLSALMDLVFEKVTSREYSITYMHKATTVFRGMLQSFTIDQISGTNKVAIQLQITKGEKNPQKPEPTVTVPKADGASLLGT